MDSWGFTNQIFTFTFNCHPGKTHNLRSRGDTSRRAQITNQILTRPCGTNPKSEELFKHLLDGGPRLSTRVFTENSHIFVWKAKCRAWGCLRALLTLLILHRPSRLQTCYASLSLALCASPPQSRTSSVSPALASPFLAGASSRFPTGPRMITIESQLDCQQDATLSSFGPHRCRSTPRIRTSRARRP